MVTPGRIQEIWMRCRVHGESLWRFSPRPALSPDARDDRRIRTQSDCRPDATRPFAQSAESRISALGVPGVRLPLYSQTRRALAACRNPPRTGRGGTGHVSLAHPRTIDDAADCQTVERAEDFHPHRPESHVACGQCALYAQQPYLYGPGT